MNSQPARPGPTLPFTLQPGEHVLRFCRRHWIHFYPALALQAAIAIVAPVVLLLIVKATVGLAGSPGRLALLAGLAWLLYWSARAYFRWYRYRNDIWVVTNQRVVDSIRRHWFHHRMSSADLVDVEDINVVRHGILPTMFNFGDVRCQTAGEVPNFILSGIPKPTEVLATIDAARDASRRSLRGAF